MEKSFSDSGRLDISSELRDYYIVRYVHGFIHSGFVYFATVQRKSHHRTLEEWGYITRIARFCTSDAGFHSYVEITLQCLGSDGLDYNILQDAFIVRVGGKLAERMQIIPNSEVLFGVFVASRDHTTRLSTKSAVCYYPLSRIESKFAENIHLCFNGSVISKNMDYIAGSVNSCPESGVSPSFQLQLSIVYFDLLSFLLIALWLIGYIQANSLNNLKIIRISRVSREFLA